MTSNQATADFGVDIAPDTVRFERLLPGPIERVWAYLTESDKRATWLAAGEMRPEVGSSFNLQFHNASLTSEPVPERYRAHSGVIVAHHRITRFDPPHALGFTWDEESEPSEVLFELTPMGDRVRLVVTHSRLDTRTRIDVSGGWHVHLAVLAARLEGREPPAFWSLLASVDGIYEQRAGVEAAS